MKLKFGKKNGGNELWSSRDSKSIFYNDKLPRVSKFKISKLEENEIIDKFENDWSSYLTCMNLEDIIYMNNDFSNDILIKVIFNYEDKINIVVNSEDNFINLEKYLISDYSKTNKNQNKSIIFYENNGNIIESKESLLSNYEKIYAVLKIKEVKIKKIKENITYKNEFNGYIQIDKQLLKSKWVIINNIINIYYTKKGFFGNKFKNININLTNINNITIIRGNELKIFYKNKFIIIQSKSITEIIKLINNTSN